MRYREADPVAGQPVLHGQHGRSGLGQYTRQVVRLGHVQAAADEPAAVRPHERGAGGARRFAVHPDPDRAVAAVSGNHPERDVGSGRPLLRRCQRLWTFGGGEVLGEAGIRRQPGGGRGNVALRGRS